MFRRLFGTSLRTLEKASSALSTESPELFNGVPTAFGWVLVPKTHVAGGWTQPLLNETLKNSFAPGSKPLRQEIQQVVDQWVQDVDVSNKPVFKKRTSADLQYEDEVKLYYLQTREDESLSSKMPRPRAPRLPRGSSSGGSGGGVTFINAWNYYMAQTYKNFSHLSETEARRAVGALWRQMDVSQKDEYRAKYRELLLSGKDILHGKIVDRLVKLKAVERQRLAKARSLAKKKKALEEELEE